MALIALLIASGLYSICLREHYDRLPRARANAINQPLALLENAGRLVQNSITLVVMAGVLATYAWWLLPVLLVSTLPALWVAGRYTWRFHQWRMRNTLHERRALLPGMAESKVGLFVQTDVNTRDIARLNYYAHRLTDGLKRAPGL